MRRISALKKSRDAASTLTEGPEAHPLRDILTLPEVACELRCSKAHLFNILSGKVRGVPPLPVLRLGRRLLVRHEVLTKWMLSIEAHEVEGQRLTGNFGR
jgi:hypothetical protein